MHGQWHALTVDVLRMLKQLIIIPEFVAAHHVLLQHHLLANDQRTHSLIEELVSDDLLLGVVARRLACIRVSWWSGFGFEVGLETAGYAIQVDLPARQEGPAPPLLPWRLWWWRWRWLLLPSRWLLLLLLLLLPPRRLLLPPRRLLPSLPPRQLLLL